MAESRAHAYAEQLDALAIAAEKLAPEAQARIEKLLEEMNRELLADLSRTQPGSYSAAQLQALKAQVDRLLSQFAAQASSVVEKFEEQTYLQTARSIDATVSAATATVVVPPVLDLNALKVVQGYTADLITGLSRDAAAKINATIQRAYLGRADLTQLVKQIGTARYGAEFTGIFSSIGEHTVNAALNEIRRLQSIVSFARVRDLKQRHPNLAKGWRHIPVARVPRVTHILADGQVKPVEEPFIVGGEELMYPRDPKGSPENTIFCSCLLYPAVSNDDLKSSDAERALLAKYGISVVTNAA